MSKKKKKKNINMEEKMKAEKQFEKFTSNINEEKDIEEIGKKLYLMKNGQIKKIWLDIMKLWILAKDPNANKVEKAIAIGALIYLVTPIDVIPDITPFIGFLDDVSVIMIALKKLHDALKIYEIKE